MLPWKKFLDLKNVSKQRLAVNFFSFFSFRNIYLQGHSLLTSRNFATVATWRNGFSPLFVPFGYSFISVPAGLLSKLAQHNNLSKKTRMGEKKKGFQSRHPELTFFLNPVIPWIFLESRGVLLGILVGVFCPVLQILTLFQAKKCHFPYPFSDLAFRQKLCYHYLDQNANKKILQRHFEFAYFYFVLIHLELKQ